MFPGVTGEALLRQKLQNYKLAVQRARAGPGQGEGRERELPVAPWPRGVSLPGDSEHTPEQGEEETRMGMERG